MKQYFWNTAAGLLNAAEAIIFSIITNRITGINDSGILTIAFSIGNLFASIGRWGIRTVQVTDGGEYSIKDYINTRKIAISIQIVSALVYIFISAITNGYSFTKIFVIILMVLIYASEMVEDTFWGHYQKYDHIETGAQVFIIRWLVIISAYSLVLFFSHNIAIAMTIAAVLSFGVLAVALNITWLPYRNILEEYKNGEKSILKKCFPIMLTNFLSFYAVNAGKFAIDSKMSNEEVAVYGFISMPVFAISLLSSFVYNPQILSMSLDFREKRWNKYRKRVFEQIGIVVFLTVAGAGAAWFIGIPVLELIYATVLSEYRKALTILIIAGGFMAIAAFTSVTLVIENRVYFPLISYGISSVLSLLLYNPLINLWGIDGAAYAFCIAMIVNAMVSVVLEVYSIHKAKKNDVRR